MLFEKGANTEEINKDKNFGGNGSGGKGKAGEFQRFRNGRGEQEGYGDY